MRLVLKVAASTTLALVVVFALFFAWGTSDSTACFAQFASESEAQDAADAASGLGVDVGIYRKRGTATSVTFSSGETGEDAKTFEAAFFWIVERNEGNLAHPGGCTVRSPFD